MSIRIKSNDEQQSSEGTVLFIRQAVPSARMDLDGLPMWEWGAEKRE